MRATERARTGGGPGAGPGAFHRLPGGRRGVRA